MTYKEVVKEAQKIVAKAASKAEKETAKAARERRGGACVQNCEMNDGGIFTF